ncbi:hypothetical protein JAAARDRAFT_190695 [Jaapia argillacea MUCL 33604]|uniref:F-box domain-containing protein n=1 Tax=Jaapia argillacea MUCL 33604 TaxID=933084 RepID=A0A067Q764_9AGAM|nr:hypothetical protein JAAARDRAFT_190695 [Jaapia argillacea MUCL 33604]
MDVDSDIWEALRSNQSSISGVNLHAELYKAWEEFDEAEVELRKLRRWISALEEKRDLTQSRCTNILSLLAPIRRLPPEILSKIFTHTLSSGFVHLSIHRLPVLLTHVCSYWRQIALSTSTLWSSLIIDPHDDEELARIRPILDGFLVHSGTAPLSTCLILRNLLGGRDLVDSVVRHAPRWNSFSIHLGLDVDWSPLEPLLQIGDGALNQLKEVRLFREIDLQPHASFLQEITALKTAPSLTSVTIGLSWRPTVFALPWSQLTYLKFEGGYFHTNSISDLFDILPKCSQLTHFSFSVRYGDPDHPPFPPPGSRGLITLPKLQSLHLDYTLPDGYLLCHLIVPNLNQFIYVPHVDDYDQSSLASATLGFQSCLQRSLCAITTLEFTPEGTPPDVFRFLDCLPSIRNIRLHLGSTSPRHTLDIIRYLSGPNSIPSDQTSGSPNLPMLESITISGPHDSHSVVEALVSMARFRCGLSSESSDSFTDVTSPTTRLVFASFNKGLFTTLAPRLEECVAAGLRLDFH